MINKLRINKILWSITGVLTLIAASAGVLFPRIYDGVFPPEFIPGAFPQDVLTVAVCLTLLVLIAKAKETSLKTHVVIIGIIGSFFYLYGIFTIERVYNYLYLLYAAIFAMSSWTLLYSLMNLNRDVVRSVQAPVTITRLSAIVGIVIATLFTLLWISALIPLLQTHTRIEYLYSIYILDLCFVMPAFLITSIASLRQNALGVVLLPAVYVVGFFVIFPLGLGELAKPFFGQQTDLGSMVISFGFSIIMLAVGLVHLLSSKENASRS